VDTQIFSGFGLQSSTELMNREAKQRSQMRFFRDELWPALETLSLSDKAGIKKPLQISHPLEGSL